MLNKGKSARSGLVAAKHFNAILDLQMTLRSSWVQTPIGRLWEGESAGEDPETCSALSPCVSNPLNAKSPG